MNERKFNEEGCTCDTPTGSESRRCSFCRDSNRIEFRSIRKKILTPKILKVDRVIRHILNRLRAGNQPQLFSLPEMHRALKVPRNQGGGSFIDNALGAIRRAGALKLVGRVRTGRVYLFTEKARKAIEKDPEVIRGWINRRRRWRRS